MGDRDEASPLLGIGHLRCPAIVPLGSKVMFGAEEIETFPLIRANLFFSLLAISNSRS